MVPVGDRVDQRCAFFVGAAWHVIKAVALDRHQRLRRVRIM
jgi:hypothetical protein